MSFPVTRLSGGVAELHGASFVRAERRVLVMTPTAPAVALGSAQRDDVLDADALRRSGREVVRRRSGGGLVVLNPAEVAWIDVVIPAGDPLWSDDVGEAFLWLGELFADALVTVGAIGGHAGCGGPGASDATPRVFRGPMRHRDLGRIVCFAGSGSGEVMVGEAKVVGMSQRRTRSWARFQCLVHGRFNPAESAELVSERTLATVGTDRAGLTAHLGRVVATVGDLDAVVDVLLERLASL